MEVTDTILAQEAQNPNEEESIGCGEEMGYRHLSGVKAYCGDDVVTHIIYCKKCKKLQEKVDKKKILRRKYNGN